MIGSQNFSEWIDRILSIRGHGFPVESSKEGHHGSFERENGCGELGVSPRLLTSRPLLLLLNLKRSFPEPYEVLVYGRTRLRFFFFFFWALDWVKEFDSVTSLFPSTVKEGVLLLGDSRLTLLNHCYCTTDSWKLFNLSPLGFHFNFLLFNPYSSKLCNDLWTITFFFINEN